MLREQRSVKLNIKPLYDRVVLRQKDPDEVTKGGIYLPGSVEIARNEAEVLAVGEGRLNVDGTVHPLSVKEGDTVLLDKFSGTSLEYEGQDLLIVREEEILAIIKQ